MLIQVISDIHGSFPDLQTALDAMADRKPDLILLCGDYLNHGPRNDLPAGYDTKACAALLNGCREKIICVRGNCDSEVDQMMLEFPALAEYALIPLGERTIFATHGHIWNTQNVPSLGRGDVLLCGHTHVPCCETFGAGHVYINPGAVSFPKNGSPRSYMTLEDGVFCWKTLDGEVFRRIDISEDLK